MNKIDGMNALIWMNKCHADAGGEFLFTHAKIIENGDQKHQTTHTLATEPIKPPNAPTVTEGRRTQDRHTNMRN